MVAIVGDFNANEVAKEVQELTANWKKTDLDPQKKGPDVPLPKEFTQKYISMPKAEQLHFYMGHVGITRN